MVVMSVAMLGQVVGGRAATPPRGGGASERVERGQKAVGRFLPPPPSPRPRRSPPPLPAGAYACYARCSTRTLLRAADGARTSPASAAFSAKIQGHGGEIQGKEPRAARPEEERRPGPWSLACPAGGSSASSATRPSRVPQARAGWSARGGGEALHLRRGQLQGRGSVLRYLLTS